jgi:hypothetical protein
MSSRHPASHETSREAPGRTEPDRTRHDESTRPIRDRVDVDWMLEPEPAETKPRPGAARGLSRVVIRG